MIQLQIAEVNLLEYKKLQLITNTFLAVTLNEPEKTKIIKLTFSGQLLIH